MDLTDAQAVDTTIQGLTFPVRMPYDEGHECTAIEAGVMNQTRRENVRNNFAPTIRKACEEAKVQNASELPSETIENLKTQFIGFETAYEFGTSRGGREADPIKREALDLATKSVRDALKRKGHKLSDVDPAKIRAFAENAIEKNPAFIERATAVVQARAAAADELEVELGE